MLCWLKSLLSGHQDCAGRYRLELTGEGVAVVAWPGPWVVETLRWENTVAVRAWRQQQPRTDIVCICFQQQDGSAVQIDESMEGFDEVNERLSEVFPAMPADWFSEVASSACGGCDRILINRLQPALAR